MKKTDNSTNHEIYLKDFYFNGEIDKKKLKEFNKLFLENKTFLFFFLKLFVIVILLSFVAFFILCFIILVVYYFFAKILNIDSVWVVFLSFVISIFVLLFFTRRECVIKRIDKLSNYLKKNVPGNSYKEKVRKVFKYIIQNESGYLNEKHQLLSFQKKIETNYLKKNTKEFITIILTSISTVIFQLSFNDIETITFEALKTRSKYHLLLFSIYLFMMLVLGFGNYAIEDMIGELFGLSTNKFIYDCLNDYFLLGCEKSEFLSLYNIDEERDKDD